MSVKFWVVGPQCNYVKLKLRPGQTLHTFYGGPDDEGWSSRAERWTLEDGVVTNDVKTDGVDCDGRMSTFDCYVCPVDDLHAEINIDRMVMPKWSVAESGQRDYAAEAAGY